MKTITLPHNFDVHPYMLPFLGSTKRFKLAVIHRRGRKSRMALNQQIARTQLKKGIFYYVLPTFRQSKQVIWDELIKDHLPMEIVDKKNDSELAVYYKNGSIQRFVGSDDPDSHRGINAIDWVFDEYSEQKPAMWFEIAQPILRENGGTATFIFTPRGRNHAWKLLQEARANPDEWFSTVIPATETGVFSDEELAKARKSMPEALYEQELMCSFVADAGQFFRRVDMNALDISSLPKPGHNYVLGIDLAKYQDFTVITPFDLNTFQVLPQERFNQVDWNLQKARIEAAALRFNNALCRIDSTGCLVDGQQILTETGYRPIEEIKNGEKVYSGYGEYRKLLNKRKKEEVAEVVSIKPQYQCRFNNTSFVHAYLTNRGWKQAGDIKIGDLLKLPIKRIVKTEYKRKFTKFRKSLYHPKTDLFKSEVFFNDARFWRLVGYYFAEGYVRTDHRFSNIIFAFHSNELSYHDDIKECATEVFGRKIQFRKRKDVQCIEIGFSVGNLVKWFGSFGHAINKKFPAWFDHLPDKFLKEIIKGYWRGDGDFNLTKRAGQTYKQSYRFHSASYDLIATMQRWLLSFEIVSSITETKREPRSKFVLNVYGSEAKKLAEKILNEETLDIQHILPTKGYFKDGFFYCPIKEIKSEVKKIGLHEFEVEKEHACYAFGSVLHNVGDPIVEDLMARGISVEPFKFTKQTRKDLLNHLSIYLEQDKIKIPNDQELIDELNGFQLTLSEGGTLHADSVLEHDDRVMSLALAVWNAPDVALVKDFGNKTYSVKINDEFSGFEAV